MSLYNSTLALEDIIEYQKVEVNDDLLIQSRHLSFGSVSLDLQPVLQVVKVSGTITVSF